MTEEKKANLEAELLAYPVMEFAYLRTKDINFPPQVRYICETECPRYGTSWSCPPAVGTVEACREKCLKYETCFVFSTIAEVTDITDLEDTLRTRMEHEQITREIAEIFRRYFGDILVLSTESCDICKKCTYPSAPCVHPDRMFPCVESYGILVTDLAEQGGMSFYNGTNVVTWFSVIFFHEE